MLEDNRALSPCSIIFGMLTGQNNCQERPHSPAGLLFGFCSKPALLPLDISPRRSIWKGFTTEPAQHRRQAAAPAPSRAVSCRRGFSKPCPTSRLKEPSPASRIFTPLPCQNRPVIRQQFRILPREEKIKLWLFLFGKQARGKRKKKKKKHTAASSFDLKRKKITYTEHRMCKNRAPD